MTAATKSPRDLFLDALERPPADRPAYLDAACAGDPALRRRVEALLAAHDQPGAFLDDAKTPAIGDATAPLPAGETGTVVAGRYTLQEKLGEGGMGEVWAAKQTEPVKRRVALKLIKAGMDTRAVLQRFEAERQALALMDHPNIARVLDGGMTADRRPFFVMELVNGQPLTRFCDEARLGIRERLELFATICRAVQHAHQKGIIHRDLKPTNILVTLIDGKPVPKVIDFGVAKAVGGKLLDESLSTQFGAVVGTLEYMAPEQAGLTATDIDTRADVYSLGVILYELLTGLRPIDARRLSKAAFNEVIRIIREEEPSKPSTRLSTDESLPSLAASRRIEPKKLMAILRGELDWVVMKCLEKQRERRYETANGLTRDVERYLANEPVEARPPSAGYRLKKFVLRHPLEVALTGTVALLVLGGGAVAWWQNEQAAAHREKDLRRQFEDNAHLSRNAEAVAALLGQCEEALRAGDASRAKVALDEARKRSAEAGAEDQSERLVRLAADVELSRDLDAIDQFRSIPSEGQFPSLAAVAARTRAALKRFGADADAVPPEEAAARVSASVVRERVLTALDRVLWHEKSAGARAVLRLADSDPYRDAVRDAVLAGDRVKVVGLADQEAALEQPPGFATFLAGSPGIKAERRRQVLVAAVRRRPDDLGLHMTLIKTSPNNEDGVNDQVRWMQAAVAAAPANMSAVNNLALALKAKGQVDDAIAWLKRAIELDPEFAMSHYNLGNALYGQNRFVEAIPYYKKATELDPKQAEPHCNLGQALARAGRFAEALESLRRGHELGSKRTGGWTYDSAAWVRQGEVNAALEARLPAFLKGEEKPRDTRERLDLAVVCQAKKLAHAATGRYAAAFAAEPRLADDLGTGHRTNAACCAALAAAGKGEDAGKLDDEERARLRHQALDWLKADLAALGKLFDAGPPQARPFIIQTLSRWQTDLDVAGVRDKEALEKLPAEERKAFAQLWADVAALLKKAESPTP